MLDRIPPESESRSWAYVAVGVLVIYMTIPLARGLRNFVGQYLGSEVFVYAVVLLVLLAAITAARNLRRRRLPISAYIILILIFLLYILLVFELRDIPEEALHVVEYGVLGLLVFRALLHRVRDFSIYIIACLVVGMIGIIDEFIQWIVPSRYYDLNDIKLNFIAGLLSQITIAAGLRPALIRGWPGYRAWSRVCFVAALTLLLQSLAFINTPPRVQRYASSIEALNFLLDGSGMMAQYGYLYDDPDTGWFRSRFTPVALLELDRARGRDVAAVLDRYIRGEGYREFLSRHSILRDPYAHEAGVHLFRREFHIDRARENPADPGKHYTIAYFENRILERYFATAINASSHRWNAEVAAEVRRGADTDAAYQSNVSSALITRFSETQVMFFLGGGIIGLLLLGSGLNYMQRKQFDA